MEPIPDVRIFSVSEITKAIKRSLETNPDLNLIWIKGEVSNLTYHSSGHIYFTMKDEKSVISATFFRNANKNCPFKLEEGISIFAFGSVTLFEKRGSYQLNVTMVKLEGVGDLQKQIEDLKKKLLAEGIFNPEYKKTIPFLPKTLGIVTSPTGAALRDIIKVALRRYKNLEIIIAPAKVQGDDAPATIIRGIEELNKSHYNVDVIIAGRGGGSFEDLMPFNDEGVVRAFFHSTVPIISAVGHQVDHPLSDEAADLAAPTPSAAAELAIPLKSELKDEIDYLLLRSNNAIISLFNSLKIKFQSIQDRRIFKDPFEVINKQSLILTDIETRILSQTKDIINIKKEALYGIKNLALLVNKNIAEKKHSFSLVLNSLEQLSPLSTINRGYALATDENNNTIRSISQVKQNQKIQVRVSDGSIKCNITTIKEEDYFGKR